MSRIGRQPVALPAGVKAEVSPEEIRIQGPKGKLAVKMMAGVSVRQENGSLVVEQTGGTRLKERELKARHGLLRALIRNMVEGVTNGYTRRLELMGAGFRPTVTGNKLSLMLGFSHPVVLNLPEGVAVKAERVESGTRGEERHAVTLTGCDKAMLGQVAAEMRAIRKADVYKGKGVRYAGEVVRKKAGKAAATAAGGTGGK
ncbi:MAG: 50S ribosomal protein L6 [Candidatus Coatesbacteria bacterium]